MRRSRELALRVALGAGHGRLYRQLALESMVLTLVAGMFGVLLAASSIGVLRSVAARLTPRAGEIQLNAPVFAFAVALCVVIALAIAAVPFVHMLRRRDVAVALRQGNTGAMSDRGDLRIRSLLVVAQVAIAFVMLVGAGVIARSLIALERVDAGIDVSNVLTARLSLSFSKYKDNAMQRQFSDALLGRMSTLPGVTSAAIASAVPLGDGAPSDQPFQIDRLRSARAVHTRGSWP